MNVKEVMSRDIRTVRMVDRADVAARVMWEHDCGAVPVVDGNQAIVGIVTDRDLCMAAYTQGRSLGEIPVTAVMARAVRTCKPDDPVASAQATLQQHQLHRLPVVDARGVVVGMLTANDLLRLAQTRPAAIDAATMLKTLAAITAPRRATLAPAASATSAPAAAAVPSAKAAATAGTPPSNATPVPTPVPIPAPAATILPVATKSGKAKNGKQKGKKS